MPLGLDRKNTIIGKFSRKAATAGNMGLAQAGHCLVGKCLWNNKLRGSWQVCVSPACAKPWNVRRQQKSCGKRSRKLELKKMFEKHKKMNIEKSRTFGSINNKKKYFVFLFLALIGMTGCFISAGTHGSLKNYQYNISKYELEKAVNYVINENPKIHRDSVKYVYSHWVDIATDDGYRIDSVPDYYNDGENYITIKIETDKGKCEYIFRYYGDKSYWDSSKTSEIFICYAYDEVRNGGSEGNGGVDRETLKYLAEIFEKEFINKIDEKLGLNHIERK